MGIISCESCGEQVPKAEKCSYCKKTVCYQCIKSQKRVQRVNRYFICTKCWSSTKSRRAFKSV